MNLKWTEPELPENYLEPHWYAVHTSSRHEKRVAEQLEGKRIDHFLPVYEAVHRWKDRRVTLHLPLFPGYVFVRIPLKNRLAVQEIPGVAQIVGFGGHPVALPDNEMEALRTGLAAQLRAEPHPYLVIGDRVRVVRGPLAGAEGILIRKKDKIRVVLSLELIMRSVAVEVDASDLEALPRRSLATSGELHRRR